MDSLTQYIGALRDQMEHTVPLGELNLHPFDVVFVVGGHGPMQDLAVDPYISDLLNAVIDDPGKILAAVCHGPASFLSAHAPTGAGCSRAGR